MAGTKTTKPTKRSKGSGITGHAISNVVATDTKVVKQPLTLPRTIVWILVIAGFIGFIASFILIIDKIKLLQDPNFHPICSLNPVISCGSVMEAGQASVFGFTNAILGVAGFSAVVTVGVAMLAGAQFKKWFWWGLEVGAAFGIIFVTWLQFQTIYNINAICLYCAAVWVVTILIFWYLTLYNFRVGNIKAPVQLNNFLQKHHGDILIVWYLVIAGLILNHFWYYFSTLL